MGDVKGGVQYNIQSALFFCPLMVIVVHLNTQIAPVFNLKPVKTDSEYLAKEA